MKRLCQYDETTRLTPVIFRARCPFTPFSSAPRGRPQRAARPQRPTASVSVNVCLFLRCGCPTFVATGPSVPSYKCPQIYRQQKATRGQARPASHSVGVNSAGPRGTPALFYWLFHAYLLGTRFPFAPIALHLLLYYYLARRTASAFRLGIKIACRPPPFSSWPPFRVVGLLSMGLTPSLSFLSSPLRSAGEWWWSRTASVPSAVRRGDDYYYSGGHVTRNSTVE